LYSNHAGFFIEVGVPRWRKPVQKLNKLIGGHRFRGGGDKEKEFQKKKIPGASSSQRKSLFYQKMNEELKDIESKEERKLMCQVSVAGGKKKAGQQGLSNNSHVERWSITPVHATFKNKDLKNLRKWPRLTGVEI